MDARYDCEDFEFPSLKLFSQVTHAEIAHYIESKANSGYSAICLEVLIVLLAYIPRSQQQSVIRKVVATLNLRPRQNQQSATLNDLERSYLYTLLQEVLQNENFEKLQTAIEMASAEKRGRCFPRIRDCDYGGPN